MLINNIGRVSDYVKNTSLKQIWQNKKENDVKDASELKKQLEDNEKKITLERITGKMKSGEKLSVADKKYLKEHAPDLYEKALRIEKEREEYKRALERCRTKEEARQLHTSKMMQFHSEIKTISSNPYVSKQDALEFIAMRAAAINNEYSNFVQNKEKKKYLN